MSAEPVPGAPARPSKSAWRIALRVVVITVIIPLLGIVCLEGRALWAEWSALREEQGSARDSEAIGYQGISPKFSYAARPAVWMRQEPDATLLWAGWKPGEGHRWFKVKPGELDPKRLSPPIHNGSDVMRAIDFPIVERAGGDRWSRIPASAAMFPVTIEDATAVYPDIVLMRVLVINDTVGDHPVTVIRLPQGEAAESVRVFPRVVAGHPVTFGAAGYVFAGGLLLYDRETRSLWSAGPKRLEAIAGGRKGTSFDAIAQPAPLPWDVCSERFPSARLIVGADRTKQIPNL